jgi:hypothetical protein
MRSRDDATLVVEAPYGEAELEGRVEHLGTSVARLYADAPRIERSDANQRAPLGDHWGELRDLHIVAVDIILDYARAEHLVALADLGVREALDLGAVQARRVLYFSPHYINMGMHFVFDGAKGEPHPAAAALEERTAARFTDEPVIPYRWGQTWAGRFSNRIDPAYRRWLDHARRACDPDGILPGELP